MRALLLGLVFLLLLGCTNSPFQPDTPSLPSGKVPLRVTLLTADGLSLAANYYESAGAVKGVILVHQLGGSKEPFDELAQQLVLNGFGVLAFDLRGHGASNSWEGQRLLWQNFSPEDFAAMDRDVDSAAVFLHTQGINEIYGVGASLGANLTLRAAARKQLVAVAALSPGLEYRGVSVESIAADVNVPVFLVSAKNDSYSFESLTDLNQLIPGEKQIQTVSGSAHGVSLLSDRFVVEELLYWLGQH